MFQEVVFLCKPLRFIRIGQKNCTLIAYERLEVRVHVLPGKG